MESCKFKLLSLFLSLSLAFCERCRNLAVLPTRYLLPAVRRFTCVAIEDPFWMAFLLHRLRAPPQSSKLGFILCYSCHTSAPT